MFLARFGLEPGRLFWGFFLLLVLIAFWATLGGFQLSAIFLAGLIFVFLLIWRFPYAGFYVWMATSPLLGILLSFPTGGFQFGERAFGGSIDITLTELVAGLVLLVWALRLIVSAQAQARDWKPALPLLGMYLVIVGAHALSAFSSVAPDTVLVLKYTLRPVFFVYLASVILPVNFITSRRRLAHVLALFGVIGVVFTMDGFISLFFPGSEGALFRAHPLTLLGVSPLGGNHNALAEVLLFSAPAILAWSYLKQTVSKEWVYFAVACMITITLLTFARSAWIALVIELIFLSATLWRPWVKSHLRAFSLALIACIPLMIGMLVISQTTEVRSSTAARATLTSVAFDIFMRSPWIGAGAGSFMERLNHVYAYTIEFGSAVDSHGLIQKLLAETGLVGFVAFALFVIFFIRHILRTWQSLKKTSTEAKAYLYLVAGALGAFMYQFFDTTYWTPRLWIPVGLVFVAGRLFLRQHTEQDPDFLSPSHG
ncbi:hypothetical protein EXS71_04115 [Candidatus Uhrbacteria bacterium]|nr:hypothetical protein [Candidatus Uhrbacteria bacterium]